MTDSMSEDEELQDSSIFIVTSDQTFSQQLQTNLYEMRETDEMTDFFIKVGDSSIPCHKLILAASCPFFRVLFESGLQETKMQEVDLNCLEEDVVQAVIKYLYTGEITFSWNRMEKLVAACDYLQIRTLKEKCEAFIFKNLTSLNCIKWYKIARLYCMDNLREEAKDCMCKEFVDVAESEDFKDLNFEELLDIVKDRNIYVLNENPVLNACIEWVKHDMEKRKDNFAELLGALYLEYCTSDFIDHVLETNEQLVAIPDVQSILFKAYRRISQNSLSQDNKLPRRSFYQKGEYIAVIPTNRGRFRKCLYWDDGWELLTDIPKDKSPRNASICELKDGFLISGGIRSTVTETPIKTCFMYTVKNRTWHVMSPMWEARTQHGSVAVGNSVYVFGGTPTNVMIERLDVESNEWHYLSQMSHNVFSPLVARLKMALFAILHNDAANASAQAVHGVSVQIYDTVKNRWSLGSTLPAGADRTAGAGAVGVHDALYVIGGEGNLCNQYSPETDTWTLLKRQPSFKHQLAPAVLLHQRKVLVLGGCVEILENDEGRGAAEDDDSDDYVLERCTKAILEYDPQLDRWGEAEMVCPRPISDHFALHITM